MRNPQAIVDQKEISPMNNAKQFLMLFCYSLIMENQEGVLLVRLLHCSLSIRKQLVEFGNKGRLVLLMGPWLMCPRNCLGELAASEFKSSAAKFPYWNSNAELISAHYQKP